MLVAKQQTTQAGYEVTWRSLHPSDTGRRAPARSVRPSRSVVRGRTASGSGRSAPGSGRSSSHNVRAVQAAHDQPLPNGPVSVTRPGVRGRPERSAIRLPRTGILMRISVAALCVVGLMLGYLGQQARYTELVYERQTLQSRVDRLDAEVERLSLEGDRLASLDRVAKVAKERLGMQEAERIARIPLEQLNNEAGAVIRTAMGVPASHPHAAEGAAEEEERGGRLAGATRVAWNRVSDWFSEWVGLSKAEARGKAEAPGAAAE